MFTMETRKLASGDRRATGPIYTINEILQPCARAKTKG